MKKFFGPGDSTFKPSRKPSFLQPTSQYYCSALISSVALILNRSEPGATSIFVRRSKSKNVNFFLNTGSEGRLDSGMVPKKKHTSAQNRILRSQRVFKTICKPHKSKEHNFLHRNYTQPFFSTPKKYFFFATKNIFSIFFREQKNFDVFLKNRNFQNFQNFKF